MKRLSLYRVELRRLALSRFVGIIAGLSLCGPLAGYTVLKLIDVPTTNGYYIANPVLAGTVINSVLWALLTLLESDRIHRAKADVLVENAVSPITMAMSRSFALITLSAITTILTALMYLPYTVVKVGYLFDGGLYTLSFVILMMPTLWISVLLASAFYEITRRVELSGLLYAGMVYFSFSGYVARDFFARWLNPLFVDMYYSDGFTNAPTLRIALYTRLLWLFLSAGAWVFSMLCMRRYQKGLPGSLWRGLRKPYIPVISAALLCAGTFLWIKQPFVNHAPLEYRNHIPSQTSYVWATEASYDIIASPWGYISGNITYTMAKHVENDKTESFWFDPGYQITTFTCDDNPVDFKPSQYDINDRRKITFSIPKGSDMTVVISYEGMPKLLRCFSPWSWKNGSSPGYVSLNNASSAPDITSFGLPSTATLQLTLPDRFTPIVDHKLVENFTQNPNHTKTWETTVKGWGFWVTACEYGRKTFDAAASSIDLFYSVKYEPVIHEYDIPQAIADVMDYCAAHLGELRFVADHHLMMVQRAGGGGGNAGDGWVEWEEPVFSAMNLSDPLKGATASEVFAHEIIHQWWGGFGVYCGEEWEVLGDESWSSEGLTVYTTYRLMKDKYGGEYAKQHYTDVWQAAVDAQERGFYYRRPEYLDRLPEQYRAQLNAQSRSTNLYCRMPLMILKAEQLAGGEAKMDEILQQIQKKYAQAPHKYNNPFTYQMFVDACGLKAEDLNLE